METSAKPSRESKLSEAKQDKDPKGPTGFSNTEGRGNLRLSGLREASGFSSHEQCEFFGWSVGFRNLSMKKRRTAEKIAGKAG